MSTEEEKINRILSILEEVTTLSGAQENTKIIPNCEVVDNSPAGLTNYVIVENELGYYIPALKAPDISYTNGDKVNLLFIKGTEPIAFQHGAASSTGGYPGTLPLTTKGDLVTRDASDNIRLAVGTDGEALVARASETSGLQWDYPAGLSSPDGSITPAWAVDNSGNLLNDGGGKIDLQGTPEALVLDADGDTTIDSFTDDTISMTANGSVVSTITPSGISLPNGGDFSTINGDYFAENDIYSLFNRLVNWGFTPDEHWAQNVDQLSWTGWASYTGYVTPASINTVASMYRVGHNNTGKGFRYRAASTGANIFLRAKLNITYIVSAGLMIDNGVDDGDGEGATNFFRTYLQQSVIGGPVTISDQSRVGGSATVTTNTSTFTVNPTTQIGLGIQTSGTLWTNWTAISSTFGDWTAGTQQIGRNTIATTGLTWTPARVGLYLVFTAVDGGRRGIYDWYDEATA